MAGLITLQRSCAAQAGARRKVKGQLQEALARASQAEKDRAAAAAASATHLHDLEKLRRDVSLCRGSFSSHPALPCLPA